MKKFSAPRFLFAVFALSLINPETSFNTPSSFAATRQPAPLASCAAPSDVSLEQYGTGIQVQMNFSGCPGATFKVLVKFKGYYTDLKATPDPVGAYPSDQPVIQVPISKEGLYTFEAQVCPPQADAPCASAPIEEIYAVVDRDAFAKNWDVAWKVPVKGVDYPDTINYSGFCQTTSSRGCNALSTETLPNHRGRNRFVTIPSTSLEKSYLNLYEGYGPLGSYLRLIQDYYGPSGRDDVFLRDLLQGMIDSADFTDYKNTGRKFMVVRSTPDMYPEAATSARGLKMMARLLNTAANPAHSIHKYRWTLLSLFRMMNLSFQVDYDYARTGVKSNRGGFRTKYEAKNTKTKKTWIDNFLVSFPGGFDLNPVTHKPVRQVPMVVTGKHLHALRDIYFYGWDLNVAQHLNDFYGIDLRSEYELTQAFVQASINRMGEPPRRNNFTFDNIHNAILRDSKRSIPYGFVMRDADWDQHKTNGQFKYLAATTTITKACGGFGGFLQFNGKDPLSNSDIGQVIGLYWLLLDSDLGSNDDIPSRSNYNRNLNQGFAYSACPNGSTMVGDNNCHEMLETLKDHYEFWRDTCCKTIEDRVYVKRDNGSYKKIKDLPLAERLTRPEYPQYCRP